MTLFSFCHEPTFKRWTGQDSNRAAARSAVSNQPFATTTTAACGRNREELLGPRSDFSKPRQGAAEKSANATRCCCLARGSQRLGMSTKKAPPAGAPYAPPQFGRHRTKRKSEPYAKTKAGYHRGDGILPLLIYILVLSQQKTRPNGLAASFLVDIPSRWEPRAKQSRTVALLTALRAAALFEPCTVPL